MRKIILCTVFILLFACNKYPKNKLISETGDGKITMVNRVKTPIMGWASWNNYRININENIIIAQTDALVASGLKKAGYSYINIDDGFFGGRDSTGSLISHPIRFPHGMKFLSDYIHSKGLKAGIYSDAGSNTCASYWDKDTIGAGVGLYGHERKDLTLFLKTWNYDFIKIDWCGGDWMELNEQSRFTTIADIIYEIKPNTQYNVCRWKFPGEWVTTIANSWRISGDISNNFDSILAIIDINADLWRYSSEGHYNDMDMLQVGRGMTFEEDKTHFSMWCLLQSPLLLGNDLQNITQETIEIVTNKDLIAINQSSFSYQARRIVDHEDFEIWARPMKHTMSGEVVIALLNRSINASEISLSLEDIGINPARGYTMKDLWTKEEYPSLNNSTIAMDVAPHGIVVLKIKGKAKPYNVFQSSKSM